MKTRNLIVPALCFAIAACSQDAADRATTEKVTTRNVQDSQVELVAADAAGEPASAPAIRASVAPGVAFDYRYSFGLPEDRIGAAQEEHAALCERLGLAHCRVTGMQYNKSSDGDVAASLAFKLDPAMAHSFARDATAIVEKAEGSLTDSVITGEDSGGRIVEGDKQTVSLSAELAKVEAQLRIPNLSKDVRGRLVEQGNELRAQLREVRAKRGADVESLATTPVQFEYHSNEAIFGFDNRSPIQQALRTSGSSFTAMLSFLVLLVGALAPWALLGGAVYWGVRRWRGKRSVVVDTAS